MASGPHHQRGGQAAAGPIDLDLLEKYLASGRFSVNTREAYRRDLDRLAQFLTSTRKIESWGEMTGADLGAWLEKLTAEGKSEASLARALSSVRAFFRFLDRGRYIAADPTVGFRVEQGEGGAPSGHAPSGGVSVASGAQGFRAPLSVEEVERLLCAPRGGSALAIRDRALLEMLYGSGLSVSEVISLAVVDVDMRLECVRTRHRGKRNRVVPLSRVALAALRAYVEEARPAFAKAGFDVLFLNRRGKPLTRQGVWKIIKGYGDRAGLDGLSPHTLRSSFASHLLANGANLAAVQEMMGHSKAATTQAYFVRDAEMRLREEYERAHPRARRASPTRDNADTTGTAGDD